MDADVAEYVKIGKAVAMLTSGSRLEVEAAIPEILIAQIREGQKVTVNFDAIPSNDFSATVTEVGVASTGLVTSFRFCH